MTVYLVGAGPGDPGLLTVRGAELLGRADVVIYDRLSVATLLDLAPSTAERIPVGKAPGRGPSQDDINDLLVSHGRRGGTVVRLKGGDPFVFARGSEEAAALAAAGVDFEVVPGITSAIAAPAYAGIPVTQRFSSTSFTVVTGHEDPRSGDGTVDWEAVAKVGGTILILMGVERIGRIVERLLAGGLDPDTPAAAVRWGTRPQQTTVRCRLADLPAQPLKAPAVFVIGRVAAAPEELSWYEQLPLFGRRIVVTRTRTQASQLSRRLRELGAEPIELPTIAVEPLTVPPAVYDDLAAGAYDWLVLTSPNGVERFLADVPDSRAVRAKLAAIGPGTATALAARHLVADLVPERFVAESLLEALPAPTPAGRILLARAEVARDVLPDGLRQQGWDVDVVPVYRTVAATADAAAIEALATADVITFTSSSTVEHFVALAGVDRVPPVVACIGPVTAATARRLGLTVTVEAADHTIDGLVAALVASAERTN